MGPPSATARSRNTPLRDRLLTRADLTNLPTPQPLIDRTVDLRSVAVLAGHWGTAKSFTAQDWAACVATGKAWQMRPVETGSVLYVAAEGAYGLNQRFEAWEFTWHHDIHPDRLAVLPEPINLLDANSVTELATAAAGRRLVVIDTLARCLPGGDENSARDMGLAVDALYRIQRATGGGTVLAVHHTGKDGTTVRGSSALEAGVDTVYLTTGTPENLTLERTKRKDGPLQDRVSLTLVDALDSAVLMSAHAADTTSSEQRLMSAFMSGHSATGASKSDLRATAEMSPASFHRALNGLVSKGLLTNTGTTARPFYRAPKET
ncbi:AAA family ATPase [Jatrophihabitans endophyticus]|nr:AAA family ATPase [Jatrophihabitans endophyticus]